MKNLKNLLAAITLIAVFIIGATNVNAGLLVSDFTGETSDSCTEMKDDSKVDWSVIVTGFTSVIVTGFTSVIVTDATGTNNTNCGILMTD